MCGICGELRFDNTPPSIQAIVKMNQVLEVDGEDEFVIYMAPVGKVTD